MYSILDKVLAMEKSYGPHRDPKLFESDPDYNKFRPLSICVEIRERYSDLVVIEDWPALSERVLEGNMGVYTEHLNKNCRKKNQNEYCCHHSGSGYHLKPNCPKYSSISTLSESILNGK